MARRRRTLRLRLTVLYGGLFLVSGLVLLSVTYVTVAHRLSPNATFAFVHAVGSESVSPAGTPLTIPPGVFPAGFPTPSIPPGATVRIVHTRTAALSGLLVGSGFALALMVIVSMALGWWMAGRALRPMRAMTAAAQDISERSLHQRLPADGPPDELSDLANTFNDMLGRLESAFASQRQFVANASHELLTPLTVERAVVEVALADPNADVESLRACCERVLRIGAQQEALIESLLTLARSNRGLDRREAVDLFVLPRDATASASGESAVVQGDPRLIERMIANLVDNGVRYNVPDGWVHVTVSAPGTLVVENTGPVVPPERVAELMEPFRRLGTERVEGNGGLGLGLSIVKAIAEAHGASLSVSARAEGGLRVEVVFPSSVLAT